jgi:hypothetical protein
VDLIQTDDHQTRVPGAMLSLREQTSSPRICILRNSIAYLELGAFS